MSKPLNQFIESQYSQFIKAITIAWAIDEKQLSKNHSKLKPIFKRYLSLACIVTLVGGKRPWNEYVNNLIEASHLSLVLGLKGYENPCCVMLRQSIELVLKHIYFVTHPVEYEWVNSHEGYRDLTFQKLLEFWIITPEYQVLDADKFFYTSITQSFGVLSRHVHVHSKSFLGYRRVNVKPQININALRKLDERTREIWPLLTVVLVAQFPRAYHRASLLEKRLIRGFLPKKFKKRFDSCLYRMR